MTTEVNLIVGKNTAKTIKLTPRPAHDGKSAHSAGFFYNPYAHYASDRGLVLI